MITTKLSFVLIQLLSLEFEWQVIYFETEVFGRRIELILALVFSEYVIFSSQHKLLSFDLIEPLKFWVDTIPKFWVDTSPEFWVDTNTGFWVDTRLEFWVYTTIEFLVDTTPWVLSWYSPWALSWYSSLVLRWRNIRVLKIFLLNF